MSAKRKKLDTGDMNQLLDYLEELIHPLKKLNYGNTPFEITTIIHFMRKVLRREQLLKGILLNKALLAEAEADCCLHRVPSLKARIKELKKQLKQLENEKEQ